MIVSVIVTVIYYKYAFMLRVFIREKIARC